MRLYSYWRSSASYRVRIALALKGIDYQTAAVHLVRDGGEQLKDEYRTLNPQAKVPLLEHDGALISQSLAMVEYLEDKFPDPALLPADPEGRARVRSFALLVACDIHPLNNLGVLKYLKANFAADEAQIGDWYRHWIVQGFAALEQRLHNEDETGTYCHGERPGLADLCLIPQVYNARRFDVDMGDFPRIVAIDSACMTLPAFQAALPENQPDVD